MNKFVNIVYDFDGTLTKSKSPEYDILYKNNLSMDDVYDTRKEMMEKDKSLGSVFAFLKSLLQVLDKHNIVLSYKNICSGTENIRYAHGIFNYFEMLKEDTDLKNIKINNYILTCGVKEYIEKSAIAKYFSRIFGSSYSYDKAGMLCGIEQIVEKKDKVDKVIKINESLGILKDNCKNMIYIGDGFTDRFVMEYVKEHGGISICVYEDDVEVAKMLYEQGYVNKIEYRDYNVGSKLYNYIKECILKEV